MDFVIIYRKLIFEIILVVLVIIGCLFIYSPNEVYDLRDKTEFYSDFGYNVYLLERLGQGECSICSEDEIKMIMSVAINRVKCGRFPNNLHDVLYQDNQFHGMKRVDRDKFGNEIISDKVKKCAKEIMISGSILEPDILGFVYPASINTDKGAKWYNKIKNLIRYKMTYHHFYSGKSCVSTNK